MFFRENTIFTLTKRQKYAIIYPNLVHLRAGFYKPKEGAMIQFFISDETSARMTMNNANRTIPEAVREANAWLVENRQVIENIQYVPRSETLPGTAFVRTTIFLTYDVIGNTARRRSGDL